METTTTTKNATNVAANFRYRNSLSALVTRTVYNTRARNVAPLMLTNNTYVFGHLRAKIPPLIPNTRLKSQIRRQDPAGIARPHARVEKRIGCPWI